jgi:hypothetical protein
MLAVAASKNRTLLLATGPAPPYKRKSEAGQPFSRWNHAVGCHVEHPECFFQPISSCNLSEIHELMVQDIISYKELDHGSTLDSIPMHGHNSPRVIVARGKLSWLLGFRFNLPVLQALDALDVSEKTRFNGLFNSSNAYLRQRLWTMQGSLYATRLNQVRAISMQVAYNASVSG